MRTKLFLVISIAAVLALTGCAYPLTLHSRDGSAGGEGEANNSRKTMSISIAGKTYTGTYIFDDGGVVATSSFGTATAISGARTTQAFGSSYGTAFVPGSNTGQAFLRSSDGGTLRCQFRYIGTSGLGECIDNQGKSYDMVIGAPK
jgi:hypothetical protein